MSDQKLARMANDIAAFFQAYPHDQAVAGIHDHIASFWTPKMRATMAAIVSAGSAELNPLVTEAILSRTRTNTPTDKEAAGPAQVGEIGASDAG